MAQPIVKYTLNKKGKCLSGSTLVTHHLLVCMVSTGNKTGYIPKYESPQDTIYLGIASGDPDPDGTPDDYVGISYNKGIITKLYYSNRIDITI